MAGITGLPGVALGVLSGASAAQKQTKQIAESGSAQVVRGRFDGMWANLPRNIEAVFIIHDLLRSHWLRGGSLSDIAD